MSPQTSSSSDIKGDFLRLCQLLTLDEQAFVTIQHLAAHMLNLEQKTKAEILEKKTVAIAKCRRKLDALRSLFEDGDVDREEYLRRKQNIERELAHWENFTTESETMSQQLLMGIDAITKLSVLW
jgi:hypothetical protein